MASDFSKYAWMRAIEGYRLTALERDVATLMFNRADPDGTKVYITEAKLAEKYGKSDRQIRRALATLRETGVVYRTRRGAKDVGHSIYRLTMPTKPDTQTGHTSQTKPDISDKANRTFQTGHEGQTGHGMSEQTGHGVSGIPDPITRSSKGSGLRDLPDMDMSGVVKPDTDVSGGSASLPAEEQDKPESALEPTTGEGRFIDPWMGLKPAAGNEGTSSPSDPPDTTRVRYTASPRNESEPMTAQTLFHNAACRDAGPWPEQPTGCPACETGPTEPAPEPQPVDPWSVRQPSAPPTNDPWAS